MVELRVINEENYEECLALNSNIECERFVDSVAYSLAEAWVFYADMKPFAIYNDDDMIGFVSMYVGDDNPQILISLLWIALETEGSEQELSKFVYII